MTARRTLLIVGAAGVLVSAYIHYYLYFHGGYRGISVDRVLGLDISRSFALQAISGFFIAWALVVSLRWDRWAMPAAVVGTLFAAGSLVAYALARTSGGLLGFTDDQTSTEAVIAVASELVAVASLGTFVVGRLATLRRQPEPAPPT